MLTSLPVRSLSTNAIERLRGYLERLNRGAIEPPPRELLEDESLSRELPVDLLAEPRMFPTRLALARYLCELLKPLDILAADRDAGLWAWLSLYYFDQVCPAEDNGTRRPGRDWRHLLDLGYRSRHRHLLYGPYQVFRQHGIRALLLLTGEPATESGIYHEIMSRRDLVANRGAMEAAMLLYFDPHRMAPRRGSLGKDRAGTVYRFIRVLQQLDLTYDIYGLSGQQILELLPAEFDAWRQRNGAM